jgi:hypothetical protein
MHDSISSFVDMHDAICVYIKGGDIDDSSTQHRARKTRTGSLPSKMRTAVAKSLTLRAALRAAATTEGEGTRS